MFYTFHKSKLDILRFNKIRWNIYFAIVALTITLVPFLQAEYPRSTTMLSKANNKYYLKNTGELYTGQVLNMSKKTWKKILETYLTNGLINGK